MFRSGDPGSRMLAKTLAALFDPAFSPPRGLCFQLTPLWSFIDRLLVLGDARAVKPGGAKNPQGRAAHRWRSRRGELRLWRRLMCGRTSCRARQ